MSESKTDPQYQVDVEIPTANHGRRSFFYNRECLDELKYKDINTFLFWLNITLNFPLFYWPAIAQFIKENQTSLLFGSLHYHHVCWVPALISVVVLLTLKYSDRDYQGHFYPMPAYCGIQTYLVLGVLTLLPLMNYYLMWSYFNDYHVDIYWFL